MCRDRRQGLNRQLVRILGDLLSDPSLTTPTGRIRVRQAVGTMVDEHITSKRHGLSGLVNVYEQTQPLTAAEMSASVAGMNQTMLRPPPEPLSLPEGSAGANSDNYDAASIGLPDLDEMLEGPAMEVPNSAQNGGVVNAMDVAEQPDAFDFDLDVLFSDKSTAVPVDTVPIDGGALMAGRGFN